MRFFVSVEKLHKKNKNRKLNMCDFFIVGHQFVACIFLLRQCSFSSNSGFTAIFCSFCAVFPHLRKTSLSKYLVSVILTPQICFCAGIRVGDFSFRADRDCMGGFRKRYSASLGHDIHGGHKQVFRGPHPAGGRNGRGTQASVLRARSHLVAATATWTSDHVIPVIYIYRYTYI